MNQNNKCEHWITHGFNSDINAKCEKCWKSPEESQEVVYDAKNCTCTDEADGACPNHGKDRNFRFTIVDSSDWKEKEREAWEECVKSYPDELEPFMQTVFDYWLSRIEAARSEVMEEQNRIHNSGRKLYQIGYAAALSEVKKMLESQPSTYCERFKDGSVETPKIDLNDALAALQDLSKEE